MTRTPILALAAGLLTIAGGSALAQSAYTAKDIVNHFAPNPHLGATRGLCIGTEAECKTSGHAAIPSPARESFDLVVTFDYNSDVLTNEAKLNLIEFGKALKDPLLNSASFVVEGHTDGRGGESYNQLLSERRAAAVVRFLGEQGVNTAKLSARGLGKSKPRVADPLDPSNRRVETRLQL